MYPAKARAYEVASSADVTGEPSTTVNVRMFVVGSGVIETCPSNASGLRSCSFATLSARAATAGTSARFAWVLTASAALE